MCLRGISQLKNTINLNFFQAISRKLTPQRKRNQLSREKDRQEIKTKREKSRLKGKEGKTRHTPQSGGDAVFEEKTETRIRLS